jgi:Bacterial HORMA domain 2
MSTITFVDTKAYTVTYVTDKLLTSIKKIIIGSGLDPAKMSRSWVTLERGVSAWLKSEHLTKMVLEIFDPKTDDLICRWDLDIIYGYSGDGSLWADTDAIRYNILKAGAIPSTCDYSISVTTKSGAPAVDGWSSCTLRSTAGMSQYSIGTSIGGTGLAAGVSYWSR